MAPHPKIAILRERIVKTPAVGLKAKTDSIEIDALAGFHCQAVEQTLWEAKKHLRALGVAGPAVPDAEAWVGLPLPALQTPYGELADLVRAIGPSPGETWVDLGAGYGRLAVVLAALAPEVRFIGYELIPERAHEGQRVLDNLGLAPLATLHTQDLSAARFSPAEADVYFLYEFGSRAHMEKTLADLREMARSRIITVAARGELCRSLIDRGHPWLTSAVNPVHGERVSIYRTG